jgi:hypothetical protein
MAVDGVWVPISMFGMIAVVSVGVPLARAYARRWENKPAGKAIPSDLGARLDRMEQAIDSIAIEVERISEGQRFTTKLLSERVPEVVPLAVNRGTVMPRRED